MKMKFRIASAVMAAITAVCAAQATAISASAASGATYTSVSQETCESASYMNRKVSQWRYSGAYRENALWTWYNTAYCGRVFGSGFTSNISGNTVGQVLHSDEGLVRNLAVDYFGTEVFMEHYPNARYFTPQLGDQYKISNGSYSKTVFVYQLPSSSNNYKLKTVEVIDGFIKYDRQYQLGGTYLYRNNETWHIEYMTRPIKQGDANGDGQVLAQNTYSSSTSDLDKINGGIPTSLSYYGKRAFIAAASLNNDRNVDVTDYRILLYNQLQNNYFVNDGRMHGNWYYVKTI